MSPFTPKNWIDDPSTATPISAAALEDLEQRVTSYAEARANHTGTQVAATISDFAEAVDDQLTSQLVAGSNVTITHNEGANTFTIDSTGGAGGFISSVANSGTIQHSVAAGVLTSTIPTTAQPVVKRLDAQDTVNGVVGVNMTAGGGDAAVFFYDVGVWSGQIGYRDAPALNALLFSSPRPGSVFWFNGPPMDASTYSSDAPHQLVAVADGFANGQNKDGAGVPFRALIVGNANVAGTFYDSYYATAAFNGLGSYSNFVANSQLTEVNATVNVNAVLNNGGFFMIETTAAQPGGPVVVGDSVYVAGAGNGAANGAATVQSVESATRFTINRAFSGSTAGAAGTALLLAYGEISGFQTNSTQSRYGGLAQAAEWLMKMPKIGRSVGQGIGLVEYSLYATYNNADLLPVDWRRTGSVGLRLSAQKPTGAGTCEVGTGILLAEEAVATTFKRHFVIRDSNNNDQFTIARVAGTLNIGIGLGGYSSVHHDSGYLGGLLASLWIAPASAPTVANQGILLGSGISDVAGRMTNLYRSAASTITSDGYIRAGRYSLTATDGEGYIQYQEQVSAPAAPTTDRVRVYAQDNGAGKTQMVARFATGAVQILATEP